VGNLRLPHFQQNRSTWWCPSPPGGPPDLIIRMLTPKMAGLGQPLVVENRAGAGGIVGTAYVAKTPPDGYTWLVTTASHVNTPPFNTNVPFDPVKDFTHVTLIAQNFGQALTVPGLFPLQVGPGTDRRRETQSRASSTTARPASAPRAISRPR
jgi:tripartite-type tricarboxylate transporter receptor subunit TctC